MRHQHRRHRSQQRNGREIVDRVVGRFGIRELVGHEGQGVDEQRVAIGRRVFRHLGADHASGAAAIVDDDLLAKHLAQVRAQNARDEIDAAARRKRRDDTNRLDRIIGGKRARRRDCNYSNCQDSFHGQAPPNMRFFTSIGVPARSMSASEGPHVHVSTPSSTPSISANDRCSGTAMPACSANCTHGTMA